jgi:hypothetical protein
MMGSLTLHDYPGDLVRLTCPKCGRKGQCRKQALIGRFGPDIRLGVASCITIYLKL